MDFTRYPSNIESRVLGLPNFSESLINKLNSPEPHIHNQTFALRKNSLDNDKPSAFTKVERKGSLLSNTSLVS
jgi:hypothetical protein